MNNQKVKIVTSEPLKRGYYFIEVNNCLFLCLYDGLKFNPESDKEEQWLLDNATEIKVKSLFKEL